MSVMTAPLDGGKGRPSLSANPSGLFAITNTARRQHLMALSWAGPLFQPGRPSPTARVDRGEALLTAGATLDGSEWTAQKSTTYRRVESAAKRE